MMSSLHENQTKILDFLLDRPNGATLEELSVHLGVTKTAAKEHVLKLLSLGLLTYSDTRGSVGRPKRHYQLSPEGHEAFPKQYSWLSNSLLELLAKNMGEEAVARLMRELGDRISESMKTRFEKAKSSAELMTELIQVLNELGYRAALKQSDIRKGAVIEATHCVYHSVAKQHPALCQFDTQLIKNVSKLDVQLESCIARGGSVCRFCLRSPRQKSS